MLKKNILFLFITLVIAGCKSNTIEINGKLIAPVKGEYILLDELRSNDLITVDSALISDDGSFKLTTNIKSPSFYLLKTDNSNFLTMLLEPGQIIELNFHRDSLNSPMSISGSEGTELMVSYNNRLKRTIVQLTGLRDIYLQNIDSPDLPLVMDRLDSLAQTYLNDINSYTKNYIDENLSSLVSLVALYQQVAPGEYILHPEKDLQYFLKVDSSLSKLYPDYEPVISLHEQVTELSSGMTAQGASSSGSPADAFAPEIALPNPAGDTIRLSSTRGSVVLLDFWAAWCAPCRMENPILVKAYDKYHRKGFDIYQVSLDKTRDAWLKGIEDDKLGKWTHVSDLKYWNSSVVQQYGIESIPSNLLLDKEGRIIASNLRGAALEQKLAELFD